MCSSTPNDVQYVFHLDFKHTVSVHFVWRVYTAVICWIHTKHAWKGQMYSNDNSLMFFWAVWCFKVRDLSLLRWPVSAGTLDSVCLWGFAPGVYEKLLFYIYLNLLHIKLRMCGGERWFLGVLGRGVLFYSNAIIFLHLLCTKFGHFVDPAVFDLLEINSPFFCCYFPLMFFVSYLYFHWLTS